MSAACRGNSPALVMVPAQPDPKAMDLGQALERLEATEKTLNDWRMAGGRVSELADQLGVACRHALQRLALDPDALGDVASMLVLCADHASAIDSLVDAAEPDAHLLFDRPAMKARCRLMMDWAHLCKQAERHLLPTRQGGAA